MRRLLAVGVVTVVMLGSAAPVQAMPDGLFPVDVVCPSGSQTIGFIDNNGSIVGFDEDGNVVQFHRLDAEFSATVTIDEVEVFAASDVFQAEIGKGKGLSAQLEQCAFEAIFFEDTVEVTEDFAALFELEYGTDLLFGHLGAEADVLSKLGGDVWLKRPGK